MPDDNTNEGKVHLSLTSNFAQPTSWPSGNAFISVAGCLRFKSRAGKIGHTSRHPCNISSKGPVDHTHWMLHTVSSIAERQGGKLSIPTLMVFGLTQLGIGMGISEYRVQKDPNSKLSEIQIEL